MFTKTGTLLIQKNSCTVSWRQSMAHSLLRAIGRILGISGLLIANIIFTSDISSTVQAQAQPIHAAAAHRATVSHHLTEALAATSEPVSFLAVLAEQPNLQEFLRSEQVRAASSQSKATMLYKHLTEHARRSQAELRAWLDEHEISYEPFYIVNMIEIRGDAQVVDAVRRHVAVARLEANPIISQQLQATNTLTGYARIPWLTMQNTPTAAMSMDMPYGLTFTKATDVWALGFKGQGIVVASQDTGVEWEHPALKARYRGIIPGTMPSVSHVYNWFDAWDTTGRPPRCDSDPQVPCDDHGHGTHTVGTMLGDDTANSGDILGMAPEATWIGCRNMNQGVGQPSSYTKCFQFFLAPYPQGGDPFTDGRPDLAPHVINNSWSCPPSEGCDADSLRQIVETVRAAGQMVVSSAGNEGNGCGTVENPIAIYDAAFSVGAHDSSGAIAAFSSRGPVTVDGSNRAKPDITAPGVAVRSTWVENGYNTIPGTSMASPHVAGAVALLWSAVPTLTRQIDLTEQILVEAATAVPTTGCGEGNTPISPNYTFGHGQLNVLAAVQLAQQITQSPITLTVSVTDWQGQPAAEARVLLTNRTNNTRFEALTDMAGKAQLENVLAGDYWLQIQKLGIYFENMPLTVKSSSTPEIQRQGQVALYLPFVAFTLSP